MSAQFVVKKDFIVTLNNDVYTLEQENTFQSDLLGEGTLHFTGVSQQVSTSITTSLSDNRVLFDEPAKFTAKLRDLKTDNNLLLLKTEMNAGHGGKSGRDGAIEEIALDYAFALKIAKKN